MSMTRSMCSRPSIALARRRRRRPSPCSRRRRLAVQRVVHQRGLAGARHAGDAGHQPERKLARRRPRRLLPCAPTMRMLALRVARGARCAGIAMRRRPRQVLRRSANSALSRSRRACPARRLRRRARRRRARGRRTWSAARIASSSCSTTSTVLPRSRRRMQRVEQALVVALVQADRGLVEDVHARRRGPSRSGSRGGCAALRRRTASRRCDRASGSRGPTSTRNVRRSATSLTMRAGDLAAPAGRRCSSPKKLHAHRRPTAPRSRGSACAADEHVARGAVQARCRRSRRSARVPRYLREFLAHGRGFGLAVAPLEVRQDAFERVRALRGARRCASM